MIVTWLSHVQYRFADASYWLEYFPPIAKEDLSALGLKVFTGNGTWVVPLVLPPM